MKGILKGLKSVRFPDSIEGNYDHEPTVGEKFMVYNKSNFVRTSRVAKILYQNSMETVFETKSGSIYELRHG